jgi:hypothetical protein
MKGKIERSDHLFFKGIQLDRKEGFRPTRPDSTSSQGGTQHP